MDLSQLVSIILFFVIMWGLGLSLTFFIKNKAGFFEKNIMNVAIGIAFFAVLAALLAILKIPLYWFIFLILALIVPVFYLFKNKSNLKFSFGLKKSHIYLLIILILTFYLLTALLFLVEQVLVLNILI